MADDESKNTAGGSAAADGGAGVVVVSLAWPSSSTASSHLCSLPSLLHPLATVFDSKRCGGGAKSLVALSAWQRLVLKELCADTLAAFKPVVSG
jgi:hypothetical protein